MGHVAVLPTPHHHGPPQISKPPPCFQASYKLVPVQQLPRIELSRTVRSLILPPNWARLQVTFMRRHARFFTACYFVGLSYRLYGMMAPIEWSGHWWLLLAPILQTPSAFAVALSFRYEFIRELSKSFEFWFFSVANIVWTVTLGLCFRDARNAIAFITWFDLENAKMHESSLHHRSIDSTSPAVLGAIVLSACMAGVSLGLIHVTNTVVWRTPRGQELTTVDLLLNGMSTIFVLMVRLAYRNFKARIYPNRSVVLCTTCRHSLRFEETSSSCEPPILAAEGPPDPSPSLSVQLEPVPIAEVFLASNVLLRSVIQRRLPMWTRRVWHLVIVLAFILIIAIGAIPPTSSLWTGPTAAWVAPVLLLVNTAAVAPLVALHHRRLLCRLFSSFDFLFLLLQLTTLSLAVCDLMRWVSHRCAITMCVSMWFYALGTHDALTPAAKRILGWTATKAAAVGVAMLMMHVMLTLELAVLGQWVAVDRVLFDFTFSDHRVRLYLVPFVYSRLLLLLVWNCRIVWRLVACARHQGGEHRLITLQGAVQYKRQQRGPR